MSRILVNTKDMPREEWLKYRMLGIGGSDAAGVVGLNHYITPYTIWANKTGRLPEEEENESMRQGRDLEFYVAQRFEEATGKKLRQRNVMFQHDTYDFMTANIDREVVGEDAGFEAKTTSIMNLRKFKNGEFPDQYYVQCVHYLAVTGRKRWYLGVLVLNQGFYHYVIERDEDEIASLIAAEKEFWETYVIPDVAPPVDGYKPTSEALALVYPGGNMETVPIFRDDIITNYLEIKQQIKLLETEKEKCEQILKSDLGDAERGDGGLYDIIWRSQSKNTFDVKRFAERYPAIDLSEFYNTSNYRVFKVDKKKEPQRKEDSNAG